MTMTQPDIATRVDLEPPGPSWRIEWRGRTWHETEQRGQHLAVIALLCGRDDFLNLDVGSVIDDDEPLSPVFAAVLAEESPWRGHQRLMFAITAFLAVEYEQDGSGEGVTRALVEVSEASAREILGALRFD